MPANNAIMRIRSGISLLFREALTAKGFVEINTPKLIAGESEGGSEVFRTDYFGKVSSSLISVLFISCCFIYSCIKSAVCALYIVAGLFGSVAATLQADGDLCGPGEGV